MSRNSESGYSSDENIVSPQEQIAKDQRRFAKTYEVEEEMMKSANGIIYTGFHHKTEQRVVIKQIPRNKISEFKQVQNRPVPSEIYYHFKAAQASNFVVAPLDWYERRSSFVLVMERLDGYVDLFEFANKNGAINEEAVRIIAGQLITCCMELARAGICHRDIKDENILINPETLEIRLIDFGCASRDGACYTTARGTPNYWPIEFFQNRLLSAEPLTVWSIGAVIYILLTGNWQTDGRGQMQRNFLAERSLSPFTVALIDRMFCPDPMSRITMEEIIASGWC
ncbi:Oidioi.mRNA.OKI2018_I69.PAR.g10637.t1.cds [Oikopleura dioica]|uniref:Serine/threonine-protein kinase 1 n=1 Tax=Oikopleura dioica TaxID=34765 RepID=A0ABN7RVY2_OIKDI|nr:Oidioi.mRNA.OKI2018_I69.PAR.g10637.t1.cds [Oikopleura dioica]